MPVDDPLPALRQAAAALLAIAPLPVVRATLQALLAEETARQPAHPQNRTAPTASSSWLALRRQVRKARAFSQGPCAITGTPGAAPYPGVGHGP